MMQINIPGPRDPREPNPNAAYVVVFLDTAVRPPKVSGAGIYSESGQTLTYAMRATQYAFDVMQVRAPTYSQAKRAAKKEIYEPLNRHLHWLRAYIAMP